MSTTPLFNQNQMGLLDKVHYMERLMQAKCKTHFLSFGIMQSNRAPKVYSIHGTITLKNGDARTISREVEDFPSMIDMVIEIMETF